MEQVSFRDFVCKPYIVIENECRPWSIRDPSSDFLVKFTFSCKSHYTECVESEEYLAFPHVLSQYSRPQADKSVVLNLDQFDYQRCCEIMSLELRDLPLTLAQRENLIRSALERTRGDLHTMPLSHNVLNLHLRIAVVHRHMIRREARDSLDAATAEMETETCTICLEEVREAAVRMPCSHVFHGGCIGEWLRINPRWPLCRFEMPMKMEMEMDIQV